MEIIRGPGPVPFSTRSEPIFIGRHQRSLYPTGPGQGYLGYIRKDCERPLASRTASLVFVVYYLYKNNISLRFLEPSWCCGCLWNIRCPTLLRIWGSSFKFCRNLDERDFSKLPALHSQLVPSPYFSSVPRTLLYHGIFSSSESYY